MVRHRAGPAWPAAAALGVLLDRALGEPPSQVHPVGWFGQAMVLAERADYRDSRAAGTRHAILGVLTGAGAGALLHSAVLSTWLAVAGRSLGETALRVAQALDLGDLETARAALPALVGRDPAGLDEREIARAVVESVAENTVDAVVAPAFWAAICGAPGALGYRAVNTLDAMVGHRSARYRAYGWASARLDDAAGYLPARLTAALVAGVRPGRAAAIWQAVRRQAPAHPSPNAGVAEAAFAAALGLRLGGCNRYGDRVEQRPWLGQGRPAARSDIQPAVRLSSDVSWLLSAVLAAAGLVDRRGRLPSIPRIAVPAPPGAPGRMRLLRKGTGGSAMNERSFVRAARTVNPVDMAAAQAAAVLHSQLTKPAGALGRLEKVGVQLAAIAGCCPPPIPEPVTVAVFAADHGVVAEGVTAWPQEVTAQMVANFCTGGAAINVLARHAGAEVVVVDVGVATPIGADTPGLLRRTVRPGTGNIAVEAAMTPVQARTALDVGADIAAQAAGRGTRMLVTGDMGIGNTTASAAVIGAITGLPATAVTGRGAGAGDAILARKVQVVERARRRIPAGADPLLILAELGGLEIAALAGFIVGAAASRLPVLVDGVIAAAAALAAAALVPDVVGYLISGHRSAEPGAAVALAHLGLEPMLDLEMRLGEGSGATLAVPLVQAAGKVLAEMATFDAAGVIGKQPPG